MEATKFLLTSLQFFSNSSFPNPLQVLTLLFDHHTTLPSFAAEAQLSPLSISADIQGFVCVFLPWRAESGAYLLCSERQFQGGAWQMKLMGVNWGRNWQMQERFWAHNSSPLWSLLHHREQLLFVCWKESIQDKGEERSRVFRMNPSAHLMLINSLCVA